MLVIYDQTKMNSMVFWKMLLCLSMLCLGDFSIVVLVYLLVSDLVFLWVRICVCVCAYVCVSCVLSLFFCLLFKFWFICFLLHYLFSEERNKALS